MECCLGVGLSGKIAGFAKFTYENNKLEFANEGGFILGISAEVTPYAPVAPVLYVGLSLTPSIEGTFTIKRDNDRFSVGGEIEGSFVAGIYGGLGNKGVETYLEIGFKGSIKGKYTIPAESLAKALSLTLNGEFYAEAKVFGFVAGEYTKELSKEGYSIYPKQNRQRMLMRSINNDEAAIYDSTTLIERNYAVQSMSESEDFYLEDIYSDSESILLSLSNGNLMIIWVGDDGTKEAENRTSLFYSIYDGTSWSDSRVICENEEFNSSPKAIVVEDKVHLVWQKTQTAIEIGDTLTDTLEKSELYYSVFDGNSFSDAIKIKTEENSVAEVDQRLIADENGIYVTWLENSENDVFLTSGINSVYGVSINNGVISTPEKIVEVENVLSDYEVLIDDGFNVVYSYKECGVNNLVFFDGDEKKVLVESEDFIGNLYNWNDRVLFMNGANVESINIDGTGKTTLLQGVLGSFELIEDEDNTSVVVISNTENMNCVYSSDYDTSTDKFGEFSELYRSDKYINDYSSVYHDGEKVLALITSVFDLEAEDVFSEYDLFVTGKQDYYDITLSDYAWTDSPIVQGDSIELGVFVENSGNKDIQSFDYTLTDLTDNSVVGSGTINETIAAGENKILYVDYIVPMDFNYRKIRIDISIDKNEYNDEDNFAVAELGNADITINNVSTAYEDKKFIVKGNVENIGWDIAEGNTLKVYDSYIGGDLILESDIDDILACSSADFSFILPEEYAYVAAKDEFHSIYIEVSTESEEYKKANNEYHLAYNDVYWDTVIADSEKLEGEYKGFQQEMLQTISKALYYKHPYVDIKAYEIPVAEAADLIDIAKEYFEITYGYSCDGTFTYDVVYDSHKNTIVKFKFNYGTDLDSSAPASTIDAEVNVLNEIKAYTNGMSDFDKAIYIHDYLILNGEYDIELGEIIENTGTLTEELRKERYEKYALLVNGTGVCDTYASAYQYLMTNCGVECVSVSSSAMNHSWNMVKLNGSWYHVDCTWDDPVADRVGLSRYDFFLLNTNEMKDNEHYSWSPVYTSTSSTYSAVPRDDTDEVSYGDGHWCYYENGDLYYSDVYGKNAVKITDMDFGATDIYNGNIYGVIGKILYRINVSDSSKKAQAIYAFEEVPRAIYIDKNGILEYYTNGKKSFETVDLNKCKVVESLTISADKNVISGGEDLQLSVVAHTSGYDIELSGDAVTWSSSDIAVATVDSYGLVTPDVAGTVVITAAFGNITADFTVEVEKWNHSIGGSITNGISWSFDEDAGILNISGDADIQNFNSAKETPWYKYRSRIVKLNISDGIKGIGEYAFANLNKIKSLKVPDSVKTICEYAFNGCDSLEKIEMPFVGSSREAFETDDAVLGYIFGKTTEGTVQYYRTDGTQLFGYQYAIPTGIKEIIITDADKISFGAFYNCYALEYLELNDEIIFIGDRILAGNTALTSLKVPFIGSNADANGDYDSVVGYFFGGTDNTGVLQYTSYTNESGSIRLRGYYYAIPETFRNIEVTNDADIPVCAFSTLSFDNIVLSDKTTEIGELAFYGCQSIVSLMILNRNCNIIDTYNQARFSGTVYGYNNSTAQSFANTRKINFVAIDGAGCPHSYGVWNEKVQAKCETGGVEHRICSVCGAEETRTTAPRGHNYSNSWTVDVNPSCEADGSKSRHCTRCSAKTDITAIAQTGHSYGAWYTKVDATCTANGVKARECGICGDEETEIIVSPGHTPDTKWTVDREATCTQSGSKSKHCIKCGEKLNITSISATGHSFGAWTTVKDATCEDSGLQKRNCVNCSDERTRTISSTGHDYKVDEKNKVEATCTTDGEITYICHCGDSYVEEIPAEGHSFDEDDEKCKVCDFDRTEDCDCGCHKDGIAGFFFRFILFFQKIFKSNQECDCGIYHY